MYARRIWILVLLALPAACGRQASPPDPAADAATIATALAARYGDCAGVKIPGSVTISPPEGRPGRFTSYTSIDGAGRILISAKYKGFSLFDALIAPDGQATILLLRDDQVVRGDLDELQPQEGDAELGIFARQLRLFMDELRFGPLPRDLAPGLVEDTLSYPLDGAQLRCVIDPADGLIATKSLVDPDGTVRWRIDYQRHMRYLGRITRARDLLFTAPDGTTIRITIGSRMKELDADLELALEAPEGWPVVGLEAFIAALQRSTAAIEAEDDVDGPQAEEDP